MNTYDFKDKKIIITGAAQGIGLEVARRMLNCGATVCLWDIDSQLLDKTITDLSTNSAISVVADINDQNSVSEAVQTSLNEMGRLDVLINNAAIVGPNLKLWEYPPEEFNRVVSVGLIGTFYVSRAVVPLMIKNNYGRIVNVSSIAGKEGNPNASAYSSAKAGVIALTKSLGKELAEYNISVNCVTPAVARTTMALQQSDEHLAYILSKIPRGRMLELTEAASMICWLATEENSFTTASVFDLSGGRATY